MRILAIHRYFWPDTPPYAVMLRALCAHWTQQGHDVEVLSAQPSYKPETSLEVAPTTEQVDGFTVRRIRMPPDRGPRMRRPRNMLRFSALVAKRVLAGPRRDVVMCSTAPQVLLGWATSRAARLRGAAFVYHCMDLHPEIGRLSGEFANPLVYRMLMRLDTAACRRAAAVVVLSDDMRDALLRRDQDLADRVMVINNFDLPEYDDPATSPVPCVEDRVTIAFTGNVGRFQALDTVVQAALQPDPELDGLRLVVLGDGAAKGRLLQMVEDAGPRERGRVEFLPHASSAEARALMREADHGLVSLAPQVVDYAYPSKTATYLSEGLPVLAAAERDSSLVRDVEEWGVGRHLALDSVDACRKDLVRIVRAGRTSEEQRQRARAAWQREFTLERRLEQWDELMTRVSA